MSDVAVVWSSCLTTIVPSASAERHFSALVHSSMQSGTCLPRRIGQVDEYSPGDPAQVAMHGMRVCNGWRETYPHTKAVAKGDASKLRVPSAAEVE